MDRKLELISLPVSDADRAKAFCTEQLGFNADQDQRVSDWLRFIPDGNGWAVQQLPAVK